MAGCQQVLPNREEEGGKPSFETLLRDRKLDVRGIITEISADQMVVAPWESNRPQIFEGKNREEIRTYIQSLSDEEKKSLQSDLMSNIKETKVLKFATDTKIFLGRPRGDFSVIEKSEILPHSRVAVWLDNQYQPEIIFVSPFFKPQE